MPADRWRPPGGAAEPRVPQGDSEIARLHGGYPLPLGAAGTQAEQEPGGGSRWVPGGGGGARTGAGSGPGSVSGRRKWSEQGRLDHDTRLAPEGRHEHWEAARMCALLDSMNE